MMKKKSVCRVGSVLCACFVSVMLTGCRIGDKELVFDFQKVGKHTVFSIDDIGCDLVEARLYLCNYKNLYGNAYGINLWESNIDRSTLEDYIKGVTLDELTQIYCMNVIAQQQGISLNENELNHVSSTAKKYYDTLSQKDIASLEITLENLQDIYVRYAIAEKLYKELTSEIDAEVSDDDARVIHIQQIFVSSEASAKTVEGKIKSGQDFSILAGSYNEGAEYEYDVARGKLPIEVEEVAFELDNDEISSMIETKEGFYFIKCMNKFDEELTEANKINILQEREKDSFESVYQEFVHQATFDLQEDYWNSFDMESLKDIKTNCFFECYEN